MMRIIYNGHAIPIAEAVAEKLRIVDGQTVSAEQLREITLANAQAHLGVIELENIIGKKPHNDTSRLRRAIDLFRNKWR